LGEIEYYPLAATSLVVNLNERNGVAFNVWQAKRDHRARWQISCRFATAPRLDAPQ